MHIQAQLENKVLSKQELDKHDFAEKFSQLLQKPKKKNDFKKAHQIIEKHLLKHKDTFAFNKIAAETYLFFKITPAAKYYALQALKIEPENVRCIILLSKIFRSENNIQLAKEFLETSYAATGNHALCLELASIYMDEGDFVLAHRMREIIATYEPSMMNRLLAAGVVPVLYDSEEHALACVRKLEDDFDIINKECTPQKELNYAAFPLALFYASYIDMNQRPLNEKICKTFRKIFPALNATAEHVYTWKPKVKGEKINITFISRFLSQNNHSVNFCYRAIVDGLPRDDFNVTVVSTTEHARDASYKFANAENLHCSHPNQLYDFLVRTPQDIIVYTDIGMEPVSYYSAFIRFAKYQCLFSGHPVTSGIDTVDFFISGHHWETPNAQEHYTEKLVLLPDKIVDYPIMKVDNDPRHFDASSFGLPRDKRIYTCPMMLQKLNPIMDDIFKGILKGDPEGVLVLFNNRDGWTQALIQRFSKSIPEFLDRIFILKSLPLDQFHHFLKIADAVLDSYPFAGGNTSHQAIMHDSPILTWPSEYFRGRVTLGIYNLIDVHDCVAHSKDDYIKLILKFAKDKKFKDKSIQKISAAKHKIFEGEKASKDHTCFFTKLGRGEPVEEFLA